MDRAKVLSKQGKSSMRFKKCYNIAKTEVKNAEIR